MHEGTITQPSPARSHLSSHINIFPKRLFHLHGTSVKRAQRITSQCESFARNPAGVQLKQRRRKRADAEWAERMQFPPSVCLYTRFTIPERGKRKTAENKEMSINDTDWTVNSFVRSFLDTCYNPLFSARTTGHCCAFCLTTGSVAEGDCEKWLKDRIYAIRLDCFNLKPQWSQLFRWFRGELWNYRSSGSWICATRRLRWRDKAERLLWKERIKKGRESGKLHIVLRLNVSDERPRVCWVGLVSVPPVYLLNSKCFLDL